MEAETIKARLGNGRPGTYILNLALEKTTRICIGKLGQFTFNQGFYYYVGSAFGPGGVAARCGHHIRMSERPRWHIDYLRRHCLLTDIVFSIAPHHREHEWSDLLLADNVYSVPAKGFGASDCTCTAHLFYSQLHHNPANRIEAASHVLTAID